MRKHFRRVDSGLDIVLACHPGDGRAWIVGGDEIERDVRNLPDQPSMDGSPDLLTNMFALLLRSWPM